VDKEENEDLIANFIKAHPNLKLVESEATLPWRDQVDGAFAAKLVKK
jgi:16S rRNA (cytosine967-C5)-methyltransferase